MLNGLEAVQDLACEPSMAVLTQAPPWEIKPVLYHVRFVLRLDTSCLILIDLIVKPRRLYFSW
jgi:hypothetical protein